MGNCFWRRWGQVAQAAKLFDPAVNAGKWLGVLGDLVAGK